MIDTGNINMEKKLGTEDSVEDQVAA